MGFLEFRLSLRRGRGVSGVTCFRGHTAICFLLFGFNSSYFIDRYLTGGGTGWGRGRVGGGEGLVMAKAWGRGVSGFIYVWSHAYAFGGRYLGFFRLLDHVVLLGFHRKLTKFVVHLVK